MFDNPINDRFFAPLLFGLGLAMIVRTLAAGGGPLSIGFIVGVLLTALGGLRLYSGVLRRRG